MTKIVISHGTGNSNVRQALMALKEMDVEVRFKSLAAITQNSFEKYGGFLPIHLRRELEKRTYHLRDSELETFWAPELMRELAKRVPGNKIPNLTNYGGKLGTPWAAHLLDTRTSRKLDKETSLFFGYLEQCSQSVRKANALGIPSLVEAQHAHWRQVKEIIELESLRKPEWISLLPEISQIAKFGEWQDYEVENATAFLAPSTQVAESITKFNPSAKIYMARYGGPTQTGETQFRVRKTKRGKKLNALYVGRITGLKGLAYLAEAALRPDAPFELTIVGPAPAGALPEVVEKFLKKVKYLGVKSRREVLRLMLEADVLILPSLVEGRSLAVLEALNTGLPCTITAGTGVEDMAGKGALMLEAGNSDSISEKLHHLYNNPHELEAASEAAVRTAALRDWSIYRDALRAAVAEEVLVRL